MATNCARVCISFCSAHSDSGWFLPPLTGQGICIMRRITTASLADLPHAYDMQPRQDLRFGHVYHADDSGMHTRIFESNSAMAAFFDLAYMCPGLSKFAMQLMIRYSMSQVF